MQITLTPEQVLALASDNFIIKSSRNLARPDRWLTLHRGQKTIWGEFPSKNRPPLRTTVFLPAPLFACDCGNRKFPCPHALALLLLHVELPARFLFTSRLPAWVQAALPPSNHHQGNRIMATGQSAAELIDDRQALMSEGVQGLDLWLGDLVRGGLASARNRPRSFWLDMANRLVDARAPELARDVRQLAAIVGVGEEWPRELLRRIGRLKLMVEGFRHFDFLETGTQADLRAAAGWHRSTTGQGEAMRDRWLVIGRHLEQDGRRLLQRTWLWGERHGRPALIRYASEERKALIDTTLVPGLLLDADLEYRASAWPLQATVLRVYKMEQPDHFGQGHATLMAASRAFTQALAGNPWIRHFPVLLSGILPEFGREGWLLEDAEEKAWPLSPQFGHGWHLLAFSGGRPIPLFGEWNGDTYLPLSTWADGRLVPLHVLGAIR